MHTQHFSLQRADVKWRLDRRLGGLSDTLSNKIQSSLWFSQNTKNIWLVLWTTQYKKDRSKISTSTDTNTQSQGGQRNREAVIQYMDQVLFRSLQMILWSCSCPNPNSEGCFCFHTNCKSRKTCSTRSVQKKKWEINSKPSGLTGMSCCWTGKILFYGVMHWQLSTKL